MIPNALEKGSDDRLTNEVDLYMVLYGRVKSFEGSDLHSSIFEFLKLACE